MTNDVQFIPHWTEAIQRGASVSVFSSCEGGEGKGGKDKEGQEGREGKGKGKGKGEGVVVRARVKAREAAQVQVSSTSSLACACLVPSLNPQPRPSCQVLYWESWTSTWPWWTLKETWPRWMLGETSTSTWPQWTLGETELKWCRRKRETLVWRARALLSRLSIQCIESSNYIHPIEKLRTLYITLPPGEPSIPNPFQPTFSTMEIHPGKTSFWDFTHLHSIRGLKPFEHSRSSSNETQCILNSSPTATQCNLCNQHN